MPELDVHEYGLQPVDGEELLTWADWWLAFHDDACCPNSSVAAARLCGCGGSGEVPSGISRLLARDDSADYFFDDGGY